MVLFNKRPKSIISDLPKPNFDIPKFPESKKELFQEYRPVIPDFSFIKSEVNKPIKEEQKFDSEEQQAEQMETMPSTKRQDSDIFIKIGKYEQAVNVLDELKDSFDRTEEILKSLQTIKQQEEKEIANWQLQIQKLKAKVLSVDSILFESKK